MLFYTINICFTFTVDMTPTAEMTIGKFET